MLRLWGQKMPITWPLTPACIRSQTTDALFGQLNEYFLWSYRDRKALMSTCLSPTS